MKIRKTEFGKKTGFMGPYNYNNFLVVIKRDVSKQHYFEIAMYSPVFAWIYKWSTLQIWWNGEQMNVIINPNSQQHAEMEFETLHM